MAKKNNYYAVKKGNEIGIFDNWADCSKQVYGCKGAIYRGFVTLQEAEAYYNSDEVSHSERYETEEEVMAIIGDNELIAYVDGSNLGDGSAFSWGIVMFSKKLGKQTMSGMSTDPKLTPYRNVAGELTASVEATKLAIRNKMDAVTIYHDYSGIRHWAFDEWETKNELSKSYLKFFTKARKVIDCKFVKVDGHTDDVFNEEADLLAKGELGIKK